MRLNNNIVAILTIIFIFTSIYTNWLVYEKTKVVGYVSEAKVQLCFNRPPTINASCPLNATVGIQYICDVNVTDDETNVLFTTNASSSLFVINSATGIIDFTPTSSQIGNYTINVTVDDLIGCSNSQDSAVFNLSVLSVTNNPPVLTDPIPDQTWNQDTTLTGLDLDDYFTDPDGDTLTYTVTGNTYITITIDSLGVVTFQPQAGWYGDEYVIFNASDGQFSVESNVVKLTVLKVTVAPPTPPSGGGGATGGGGAGKRFQCEPDWSCTPWSECSSNGTRYRVCTDLMECRTTRGKPTEVEPCIYIPHCYNGLKDADEEGIDCGGTCKACPTCFDGIQNQGETGIDCGGPCKICPGCNDGIQNNGEEGIDCGGTCRPCLPLIIEKPIRIIKEKKSVFLLILLILLILLLWLFRSLAKKKKKSAEEKKGIAKKKWVFGIRKAAAKKGLSRKERRSEGDRIEQLKKKIGKDNVGLVFDEFSSFIRGFYKRAFKIEHEFSHKELEEHINKSKIKDEHKKEMISFYNQVEHIKYGEHELTKEELDSLLNKAKRIIGSAK